MSDPVVVTYHDVTLHESDVGLLDGSNWLNDNIIAYYFEYVFASENAVSWMTCRFEGNNLIFVNISHRYLTYEIFKDFQNDVAFIHPSTMFLSTFMESKIAFANLNLPTVRWKWIERGFKCFEAFFQEVSIYANQQ
jgi:hypothetical protein